MAPVPLRIIRPWRETDIMGETKEKKQQQADCEHCQWYDYDEEYDEYVCNQSLDEDDMVRVMTGGARYCPFFKYYDEYMMVRKQN